MFKRFGVTGTKKNDVLTGTDRLDIIFGKKGNDVLDGGDERIQRLEPLPRFGRIGVERFTRGQLGDVGDVGHRGASRLVRRCASRAGITSASAIRDFTLPYSHRWIAGSVAEAA